MKQTAVEWFAKELESYGDPQICKITWEDLDSLVNQAKAMEKEQIFKVYFHGWSNGIQGNFISQEEYYIENFKSE